jgi:hypothetical protein
MLLWFTVTADTASAASLLTVVIRGPDTVQSGKDITIDVTIANTSNATYDYVYHPHPLGQPGRNELISVWGANLEPTPKTAYGIKMDAPLRGSSQFGFIEPQQALHFSILVNKIYDMTSPGTYYMQLQEYLGNVVWPSNVIKMVVTN